MLPKRVEMPPKRVEVVAAAAIGTAVERVRAGFIEMPGLRLTIPQAARLWGLDQTVCHDAIGALVRGGFLRRTPTGLFTRAGDTK